MSTRESKTTSNDESPQNNESFSDLEDDHEYEIVESIISDKSYLKKIRTTWLPHSSTCSRIDWNAIKYVFNNNPLQHETKHPLLCASCGFNTEQEILLELHQVIHSDERAYMCPYCLNEPYITIRSLIYTNHLKKFHSKNDIIYSCAICAVLSSTHNEFLKHYCNKNTRRYQFDDSKNNREKNELTKEQGMSVKNVGNSQKEDKIVDESLKSYNTNDLHKKMTELETSEQNCQLSDNSVKQNASKEAEEIVCSSGQRPHSEDNDNVLETRNDQSNEKKNSSKNNELSKEEKRTEKNDVDKEAVEKNDNETQNANNSEHLNLKTVDLVKPGENDLENTTFEKKAVKGENVLNKTKVNCDNLIIKSPLKTAQDTTSSEVQTIQPEATNNVKTKNPCRRSERCKSKFVNYNVDFDELIEKPKRSRKKVSNSDDEVIQEVKPKKQRRSRALTTIEVKRHICSICGYVGRQETSLKYHMRLHMGEKPYKCDQCDYRTAWKSGLIPHKRSHSGVQPFECLHCNRNFFDTNSFRIHLLTKHRDTPSSETMKQAQQQNFIDMNKARLRNLSIDNQSGDAIDSISASDSRKRSIHSFSGHMLDLDSVLKVYNELPEKQKRYNCEECNYGTDQVNLLSLHCVIHSGEKVYRCPYCVFTYITDQSKMYTYHILTSHPGQALAYACAMCPHVTLQEVDFIMHACGEFAGMNASRKTESESQKPATLSEPHSDVQIKSEPHDEYEDNFSVPRVSSLPVSCEIEERNFSE